MTSGVHAFGRAPCGCQAESAQALLLQSALDHVKVGIIVVGQDLSVQLVSRAASIMLGLNHDCDSGAPQLSELLAASPSLKTLDAAALQTALLCLDHDAATLKVELSSDRGPRTVFADVRRAAGLGWVVCLEDLSDFEQSRDWLLEHASSDPLTGLSNREHFMLMLRDRLGNASESAAMAILKIRLPHLGGVHHEFEHTTCDTLLRLAAARLETVCDGNALLARTSENEFAVAVDAKEGNIAATAARVMDSLSRPYLVDDETIPATAFIGVAMAPQDGTTPETLLKNAALALNSAEAGLRGSPRFFERKLTEHAAYKRGLEMDLRRALAGGEFELHYQPQIDMLHEGVTGVEALIRWRSPGRGLVSPVEFIPIAEELDLICPIGDWVLRTACKEAASWNSDVSVAVNASPKQFETGTFARSVAEALAASGLPPHRLEIEITESLLLGDGGAVVATLSAIHDMGVGLVLDDFGTGYASLSQLSRFCFDKIKIDRSFISVSGAPQNSAIVRAIAALGTSLGIPTTAEGVETAAQLQQVRAHGCTSVQGYYFSKPVAASAVPDLLKTFAVADLFERRQGETMLPA